MNLALKISGKRIYSSLKFEGNSLARKASTELRLYWKPSRAGKSTAILRKVQFITSKQTNVLRISSKNTFCCLSFPCSSQRIFKTSITLQLLSMELLLPFYVNLPCLRQARWLQKPMKRSIVNPFHCIWSKAILPLSMDSCDGFVNGK